MLGGSNRNKSIEVPGTLMHFDSFDIFRTEESAAGRVMNTGPVEVRDARVRRWVWSACIVVKSTDEESRGGIMFASSACCATMRMALALGGMLKASWLRGKR